MLKSEIERELKSRTLSSTRNKNRGRGVQKKEKKMKNRALNIYKNRALNVYLIAKAIRKVIAGTEFCIADAKVGDALYSPKRKNPWFAVILIPQMKIIKTIPFFIKSKQISKEISKGTHYPTKAVQ